MHNYDFLIIGSGIAGLSLALKLSGKSNKIAVITKNAADESNTKYAQGGIAVVTNKNDSFKQHIEDTMIAGDNLNDKHIVDMVIRKAPEALNNLIDLGVNFDKNIDGEFNLSIEGGHSHNRLLHYKDRTGFEIERSLINAVGKNSNITVLPNHFAIDLITEHHLKTNNLDEINCYGCYALNTDTDEINTITAQKTFLSTGGLGQLYSYTTNPLVATGDGIALAYRAKAKVRNLEFIQFHPTALYNPNESPAFLISETVRGAGAILRRQDGYAFMHLYDKRKELAPRDIVARAIDAEIKKSGHEYIYLDARNIDKSTILAVFPNIYNKCLSIGIDMLKDMIPIIPAAHYSCGGILVDDKGRTVINNLYACGECSSTGLHGANRLGSNSLLEALVFSDIIYTDIANNYVKKELPAIPEWNDFGTTQAEEQVLVSHNTKELQNTMFDYVGVVRSDFKLNCAKKRIALLREEIENFYKKTKISVMLCQLRNSLLVSDLIIKSALARKESIGLHFNTDYPCRSKDTCDTIL